MYFDDCIHNNLEISNLVQLNKFYLPSHFMQIVNWKSHLKFPEEARLSPEAKDLISKLLCNVNQRLGSNGASEIKVLYGVSFSNLLNML
jgi:hypothetical protein